MCLFVHVFLFTVWIFVFDNAQAHFQNKSLAASNSNSIQRSLYSFGDSFVDPGNNNFLTTDVRSDSPPYGNDYPEGATGRFSNGLLFPDLLAHQVLNVRTKDQFPYLSPELNYQERVTAISFASAGCGYDPDTAIKNKAISMTDQVDRFRRYKDNLERETYKYTADNQIKEAVFYVGAGSDDFVFNYFCNVYYSPTKKDYEDYKTKMLSLIENIIEDLSMAGARRIAVTGLPPLGCIPIAISKIRQNQKDLQTAGGNRGGQQPRKCLDDLNRNLKELNKALRNKLGAIESQSKELNIAYIDFYDALLGVIQNPKRKGYDEVNKGCCGTGLTEIGPSCNEASALCDDASKYVFWDAAHPTEKTYEIIYTKNREAIAKVMDD